MRRRFPVEHIFGGIPEQLSWKRGVAAAALLVLLFAFGSGPPALAHHDPVVTIALEGDAAPGTGSTFEKCPANSSYSEVAFDEPMVNEQGDVLFLACLEDGRWALYLREDGRPTIGARAPR